MAKVLPGILRVVGTPLGNLGDMSDRAREALASADAIACEDTRRCGQLLKLMAVKAPKLVSFHKDNERAKVAEVVRALQEGQNIALVSDGGMPGISDPGAVLVAAAREAGLTVEVVPGASAVATAVAGSGFEGGFVFGGFLERKASAVKTQVARLDKAGLMLVFYDSPQRVGDNAKVLLEVLGNRKAWLARELTKLHEEWIGADLEAIAARLEAGDVKGECVWVIERNEAQGTRNERVGDAEIVARLVAGEGVKAVAAWVAETEGGSKSTAYARVQALKA
jgi:16S rRNA (cytidine1402-2'-O)-methyltransferase